MNPSRLPFAARIVRWWVRCYTLGLPARERDARLAEIESDIWEQVEFSRSEGAPVGLITLQICTRLLFGTSMDLSWRLSRRGAERAALDLGAKSMAQGGAGAFHFAFKTRLGVSALAVTTAFLLTAGSLTAIRDQAEVGDRVDTSLVGIGLSDPRPAAVRLQPSPDRARQLRSPHGRQGANTKGRHRNHTGRRKGADGRGPVEPRQLERSAGLQSHKERLAIDGVPRR